MNKNFTENYFDEKGKMIGQDCHYCGKKITFELNPNHIKIPALVMGPYHAHKKCHERIEKQTDEAYKKLKEKEETQP